MRTIIAWCDLLKPENHLNVPIVRMELTFDDNKMQFYPTVNAINDLLNSVVDKIATSLPSVSKTELKINICFNFIYLFLIFEKIQTVKGFINSENELIDTSVADHYIKDASKRLKTALEYYLIEPTNHLQSYSKFFNL